MPLTAFAAIIGAKQRLGRVNQTSRREPIFNAPGVVVGLLAVLVAVHIAREWVLPQFYGEELVDRWTVALAFVPARYGNSVIDIPGGALAGVTSFLTHSLVHIN